MAKYIILTTTNTTKNGLNWESGEVEERSVTCFNDDHALKVARDFTVVTSHQKINSYAFHADLTPVEV
jgi:hypothetical protein